MRRDAEALSLSPSRGPFKPLGVLRPSRRETVRVPEELSDIFESIAVRRVEIPFSARAVRADFPALGQMVGADPLAYLDNASTTQLPLTVIEAVSSFGRQGRGNTYRGVHAWSERATGQYQSARQSVQLFINARAAEEIVFVRGATEGLNLIARCFGAQRIRAGDEILVSMMEHHSNLVPWQLIAQQQGAALRVVPLSSDHELTLEAVDRCLSPRTRLIALAHVSNVLGSINPISAIAELAHARSIPLVVDGAQAVGHFEIDVQALGADFYVFSGHKMFGPMGVGVVYGRAELLEEMPPYATGGGMIRSVDFERTSFAPPPERFEAGTPNIEGVVGLGAAIAYLNGLDREAMAAYERSLLDALQSRLSTLKGLTLFDRDRNRSAILSLVADGIHAHDVGTFLDRHGVAVRAGHHCAEPLMRHLGVPATLRVSVAFYNTLEDIDRFVSSLEAAQGFFG